VSPTKKTTKKTPKKAGRVTGKKAAKKKSARRNARSARPKTGKKAIKRATPRNTKKAKKKFKKKVKKKTQKKIQKKIQKRTRQMTEAANTKTGKKTGKIAGKKTGRKTSQQTGEQTTRKTATQRRGRTVTATVTGPGSTGRSYQGELKFGAPRQPHADPTGAEPHAKSPPFKAPRLRPGSSLAVGTRSSPKRTPRAPVSAQPATRHGKSLLQRIRNEADTIHRSILQGQKPSLKFPLRSLQNVSYQPKTGYFRLKGRKKERTLTVGTVKTFAQTLKMISLRCLSS